MLGLVSQFHLLSVFGNRNQDIRLVFEIVRERIVSFGHCQQSNTTCKTPERAANQSMFVNACTVIMKNLVPSDVKGEQESILTEFVQGV